MYERTPQPAPETGEQPDRGALDVALWTAIDQTPRLVDAPRVWVGSVEDYQAGQPYGRWIEAGQRLSLVERDIQRLLKRAPHTKRTGSQATGQIFTSEGFAEPLVPGMTLRDVVDAAYRTRDTARAFQAWSKLDETNRQHHRRFPDVYQGRFDSLHDWVVLQVEQAHYDDLLDHRIPAHLRPYVEIDIDALGHDLCESGAIVAVRDVAPEGVWIFDTRITNSKESLTSIKQSGTL